MYPKVLIFTPTYEGKDYCRKEFLEAINNINYPNYTHLIVDNSRTNNYAHKLRRLGHNVVRVPRGDNSRVALANAQNYAREKAINEGYDYLLSIESDIIVPPDIVWRLMRWFKPVVGALYYIGGIDNIPRVPCVFKTVYKEESGQYGTSLISQEEHEIMLKNGGLQRVHGMGLGCTLIDVNILKKYYFWTDNRFNNKHSDVYFYMELWNDGVPVFVDYDTVVEHYNSNWKNVKDK